MNKAAFILMFGMLLLTMATTLAKHITKPAQNEEGSLSLSGQNVIDNVVATTMATFFDVTMGKTTAERQCEDLTPITDKTQNPQSVGHQTVQAFSNLDHIRWMCPGSKDFMIKRESGESGKIKLQKNYNILIGTNDRRSIFEEHRFKTY